MIRMYNYFKQINCIFITLKTVFSNYNRGKHICGKSLQYVCMQYQAHYVNFDLAKRVLFQLGVSPISISHHWRVLYFILYASQMKKKTIFVLHLATAAN